MIGITGGIATGKSTFGRLLLARLPGAEFFDADRAARELTDGDAGVRGEISAAFGPEIYDAGHLNREALRTIIFADSEKKRALEQILHPRIRSLWASESRRASNQFFLADIPLLYETGGESSCDRVVVVACSACVQLRRLMARSSLPERAAQEMISAQMPLEEKMKRAQHVVWNNGSEATLNAQAEILARAWM